MPTDVLRESSRGLPETPHHRVTHWPKIDPSQGAAREKSIFGSTGFGVFDSGLGGGGSFGPGGCLVLACAIFWKSGSRIPHSRWPRPLPRSLARSLANTVLSRTSTSTSAAFTRSSQTRGVSLLRNRLSAAVTVSLSGRGDSLTLPFVCSGGSIARPRTLSRQRLQPTGAGRGTGVIRSLAPSVSSAISQGLAGQRQRSRLVAGDDDLPQMAMPRGKYGLRSVQIQPPSPQEVLVGHSFRAGHAAAKFAAQCSSVRV